MKKYLLVTLCVVGLTASACTKRKNNDDNKKNSKSPTNTIEETQDIVTDGEGNTVTVDLVVPENQTPPPEVVTEITKVDNPGSTQPETPVVTVPNTCEPTSSFNKFGPHCAETSFLTSEGKTILIKGFSNEALSLSQSICLRAIAKAAGDYVKANPSAIQQFNDKNVSIWSMVRLYDRRANPSASPVSPGIYFLPSANNSVFNGKWVIRGSFVKTNTGDECRTPDAASLKSGFAYYAQQILGK